MTGLARRAALALGLGLALPQPGWGQEAATGLAIPATGLSPTLRRRANLPPPPRSDGQGFGGAKTLSVEDLAAKVPAPAPRGASGVPGLDAGGTGFQRQGGTKDKGGQPPISIVINGANRPNAELAGDIQRHITENWNFRSHDLEPELT